MNGIGKRICEGRKLKGLTQEELAELSKVNIRTIQRLENDENIPRGKTLSSICEVLEIDQEDFQKIEAEKKKKSILNKVIEGVFLIILNFVIISIYGYVTLAHNANLNSRFGGILLSFLVPYFIVSVTRKMSGIERVLKFGSGHFFYFIFIAVGSGLPRGFISGLYPSLGISLMVLYYGSFLFGAIEQKNN